MASRSPLAELPNELLDPIFSHLHGDRSRLNVFLYNQRTHSSAAIAIYRHIDLSVRAQYRSTIMNAGSKWSLEKFLRHDRYQRFVALQKSPASLLSNVRSLMIDIPTFHCDCPSQQVRQDLYTLVTKLPNLQELDICFLRARTSTAGQHTDHSQQRIHVPSSVRRLTINNPEYMCYTPQDSAMGRGLDMLTFRTDCIECESRADYWYQNTTLFAKPPSVFRNVKGFRFEVSELGLCNGHWDNLQRNNTALEEMMKLLRTHSADTLERLEMQIRLAPFDNYLEWFHGVPDYEETPAFLTNTHVFCKLKVLRMPHEMLPYVVPAQFSPNQDITFEVVLDPRTFAKDGDPRKEIGCADPRLTFDGPTKLPKYVLAYIQTLAKIKVFFEVNGGAHRKLHFILEEYPKSWFDRKLKRLYIHGDNVLTKWYSQQLKATGPQELHRLGEQAPRRLLRPRSLLPPDCVHIEYSTLDLVKWVRGRYVGVSSFQESTGGNRY